MHHNIMALIHQSSTFVLSPSRRWFYSRVGSFRAPPPSEVAVSAGRCDTDLDGGSGWRHQGGVGVSIIKVRMSEKSYYDCVLKENGLHA